MSETPPLSPRSISLIVPFSNGGEAFAHCLAALAALNPAPGEIIAVDDGATDGSAELARASKAIIVRTPRPRSGPAIGRNLAAEQAHGAILFFVDADVLVKPDAISRLVEIFNADQTLFALYGSYDETPPAQNFISQYKNLFHHFVHQESTGAATSFWAGCGAIRRDVFMKLGGYSSAYTRPSIEDIELGYRLKKAGYRSLLVKELQVTHLKKWTLRSLLESDLRDRAVPWTRLILRDREFPTDLNLKFSHRLSVVLVYLLLLALISILLLPFSILVALFCLSALGALNYRLYIFFAAQRGFSFALMAIPLHWFYYFYSGLAFALVWLQATLESRIKLSQENKT